MFQVMYPVQGVQCFKMGDGKLLKTSEGREGLRWVKGGKGLAGVSKYKC